MSTRRKLLVTGGAGFIGSNFVQHVLETRAQVSIVNLDKLTYAGNLRNLEGIEQKFPGRYRFVKGSINDTHAVSELIAGCDAVVHFAAESHVDRSILDAGAFIETNVNGTMVLLNAALTRPGLRFVHVSTDEVYGTLGDEGAFTEETPLAPNSPYSASKAASDMLVRAYVHTHKLDAVTTRCSNNYGPYQFPEKLIPLMITNALEGKPLPVYGKGENVRDWIYVIDHCEGIMRALEAGKPGEVYNFGGLSERRNIDVVKALLKTLNKPESLIRYVEDRKGHDWRYAIDCAKAERELSWKPSVRFESGLERTVRWYLENKAWWEEVKSGAYRDFYQKYYGEIQ
ncbi:MAG: dTDP-glucose 4,6-dehydratase [Bdellovibrionota bacterium]